MNRVAQRCVVRAAVLLCLAPVLARAYTPDPGTRAYPLTGRDLVSGKTISLEDYRGKWVLLEFWQPSLGAKLQDLPVFVDQVDQLRGRNDFAVLTVAVDDASELGEVRRLIRRYHMWFPVLWLGWERFLQEAADWEFTSFPPHAFMIDPQGNLAYSLDVDEHFAEQAARMMDRFKSFPPYALSWSRSRLPDGSYELILVVTSPAHQPLDVFARISTWKETPIYGEERNGEPVDAWISESRECYSGVTKQVRFGEFGDARLSFNVRPERGDRSMNCYAALLVPWTNKDYFELAGMSIRSVGSFELNTSGQP